jgi:predicted DNA-binding transcriptional regulator AlpA
MEDLVKRFQIQEDRLKNIENLLSLSKNILNLEETCRLTGLSKSSLYKLTCMRAIPFYKQSKHLFFDRLEIEGWLKSNRHKPTTELEKQANTYTTLKR